MDYSVRSGEQVELVATLRQFAADRAERSEDERADEATRAADALEQGGEAAYFERVIYVVGAPDRYSVVSGSRADMLVELGDAAAGWRHQGKVALASQAADGYDRIGQGAQVARVGHLLYLVRA